jgi:hypothetical protein
VPVAERLVEERVDDRGGAVVRQVLGVRLALVVAHDLQPAARLEVDRAYLGPPPRQVGAASPAGRDRANQPLLVEQQRAQRGERVGERFRARSNGTRRPEALSPDTRQDDRMDYTHLGRSGLSSAGSASAR